MTSLHDLSDIEYINKLYESEEEYKRSLDTNRGLIDDEDFSFLYRYGS